MYHYRAMAAGMALGIACLVNLAIGGIVGALFFTVGLLGICVLELDLFTGKVRDLNERNITVLQWLNIFLGNILGIAFILLVGIALPKFKDVIQINAIAYEESRIGDLFSIVVMRSTITGICIQFAVDMWKRTKSVLCVIIPTAIFVLLGADHCIASVFYYAYGKVWQNWYQILAAIIGNVSGSFVAIIAMNSPTFFTGLIKKLPR